MRILLITLLVYSGVLFAQQDGRWTAHLPYNTVTDIAVRGDQYFCASNQGLFMYDAANNEINTYSKLNGLNDIGIGAIAYNLQNDVLIVGYSNANIDLVAGNTITNLGDIKRASGFIGRKRINHITTRDDAAWLATGFGIVKIDLITQVVDETYIIGPNGTELEVYQTAIDETANRMYAATPNGLYSADMSTPLIFFQFWERDTTLSSGEISSVATLNGRVFANKVTSGSVEDSVFVQDGTGWYYLVDQGVNKKLDMRVENNFLVITNPFTVNFFTADVDLKYIIGPSFYEPGTYLPLCGYMMPNGTRMLIGNDQYGLIICDDVSTNQRVQPNGPFSTNAFALAAENNRVYVAPGAISETWTNEFINEGIFTLNSFTWGRIPPEDINDIGDIVNILIDPSNNTHVYAAAWGRGILELQGGQLLTVWNNTTSGGAIQGPPGDLETVRTGGVAFDVDGNLWVTSSLSERSLSVMRTDGTWESYSAGSLGGSSTNVYKILVNQLNQKWVQTRTKGFLVMDDERDGTVRFASVNSGTGSGNLPNNTVLDFDEDLDGDIWIGTSEGLVVLYSPQNVFQSGKNFDAQPVLFEEDGVVQRLLGTEAVNAVAVDGANKKWFGTLNSGVFYTSADGTETIYNFTAENSPLLSNAILDIAIDDETGEVYFATAEGIVSFRGSATRGYDEYTDVYAYPNPVRPGYDGPIYIRGLVTNARVKITDVAGNIVFETVAEGGQARWDGLNLNGEKVVSGIYVAYITDDLAERTTVTKIMVIR
jgi:hypothetical protein